MKYFDLHCDTLSELYGRLLTFDNNKTHINKAETFSFERYCQNFAVWSDPRLTPDEGWARFSEIAKNVDRFGIPKKDCFLSVEGAEIINGQLERLDEMYALGVRVLTLMWKGKTSIGGAYNTDIGLDRFGIAVLRHCFHLDIVPDVSHASDKAFIDIVNLACDFGKPIIATHSNSRELCNHPRNLTDDMFKTVRDLGGIVGVSFCPEHLNESGEAGISDVLSHIEHYIMLDGEDTVAIGGDFDGIPTTPEGLSSVRYVTNLAYEMEKRGYGRELTEKILFGNADEFFKKNIKRSELW